jgi:hypothetical protein
MIDDCVSHIDFYSCSTAGGAAGQDFLGKVAMSIGSAGGWTDTITVSTTYFDANAGARFVTALPEPTSLTALLCGSIMLLSRTRKNR